MGNDSHPVTSYLCLTVTTAFAKYCKFSKVNVVLATSDGHGAVLTGHRAPVGLTPSMGFPIKWPTQLQFN